MSFNKNFIEIQKRDAQSASLSLYLFVCRVEDISAVLAHFGEAIAAIHRTIGLGLKGNLGLATASGADSGEVLTGTASSVLASVAAGLATLRLILEAALSIEFLLTGGENELVAALFAN